MKKVKKFICILLSVVMLFSTTALVDMSAYAENDFEASSLVSLEKMPIVDHGSYKGNQGDSTVYNLNGQGLSTHDNGKDFKRNGNVGIDGTTYSNGFEVWIARWNFTKEISWAYATFNIDGKYETLTGKTNLIKSYNTTNFDTTVYFYDGETLLASYNLTPSNYAQDINVDVGGVTELKLFVKDNVAVQGGTSFAIYDLFLSDNNKENIQIFDKDKYTQQHLDFVNSKTFDTASNDFRYATILWNNYYSSTSQEVGEFVYDIQEGFFETISFQGMSSLENPYDAIILDLLSSKSVKASLSDAVDSSAISVIDSVIGDLITTFQADSDWANDIEITGNFKDLLDLEATDYSSNKLYKSLDKLFDGKSTDQINSIFKKYDCYSNILANVSDAAKGVDYFLEILKYTASIEAYYSASEEFKAILKEVADVMPSVNADYGQKFNETYNNYSSCIDYNSVKQNVLNHAAEEGFWLLTDLMSDVLQDSALTFCKTALKMSESAAGTLVASLWAAETGFNLGNMITDNDTLVNCRRLLRANYMLDEAVHYVMCTHASELKTNSSYDEALYFDATFNLFKNLQINSLALHQKYMRANSSSFINFLIGKQDYFKKEAEAQAVIIDTWKNIKCHKDNLIDSITYSKSNTVVVACPTNVYVYHKSDGELVASVVNNEVYNTDYELTVIIKSNEKAICLPNLNDYEIKIEATDNGSMEVDYIVSSLERPHYERAVIFNNVDLSNQSIFDFQVDSESNSVSLVDENQNIVLPNLDTSDLIFKSASLTLQDDLVINYKVNETLFSEKSYTNPYVVFSLNGVETKVTKYTVENGKYIFDFEDIIPHQMNDTIYATLYATYNGVEYASEVREYSVATYCYNMLDKYNTNEYSKLQTLLVDLLNYGAASQIYMDYKTDSLVNVNLTEEQKAWGTSMERTLETVQNLEYKTIDNPSVQWKGGGLNLQKSVGMRFKISADNIETLTVKVTNDIGEETIITSDAFEVTDGGYYVFFEGLNAGQMSDVVYLTVYDGETAVSNTIRYSIESYAYSKQNSNDVKLSELVKAMIKYGDSAKAYIN